MKLIVLIVVSIIVFSANCRDLPSDREQSDGSDAIHNLSDDLETPNGLDIGDEGELSNGYDSSNSRDLAVDHNLFAGPNIEASTLEPEPFSGGPTDFVFSINIEDGGEQNERKLRGSSKFRSDILCSFLGGSCITNSSRCSGREVLSVCGLAYKCCIPVNLEVKVHDLETKLQSMVVNLTVANTNLNTKIESKLDSIMSLIMSANSSLSNANTNLDLKIDSINSNFTDEFQFINENLTSANAHLDSKLDSVKENQVNLEVKVHDLETKLQSMVVNLTVANSNLNTKIESKLDSIITLIMSANSSLSIANTNLDLKIDSINSNFTDEFQFIKENLTGANAHLDSKLDSVKEDQGCPEGLFLFAPSNQCFKMMNDTKRSWDDANTACRAMGLVLAQPYDPVAIRDYIITKYGDYTHTWIGARGTGSAVQFQRSSRPIGGSNPLWVSRTTSTSQCLLILTVASTWKSNGEKVYHTTSCTSNYWALCELATE